MEQYKYMVLNGAIGDTIGAPIEMMPHEIIHQNYGYEITDYIFTEKVKERPYTYTDDTEMTIAVIDFLGDWKKGLVELTKSSMLSYYTKHFEPFRGYSSNTQKLFINYIFNNLCEEQHKDSNGGLMRVAPISIICNIDEDEKIMKLVDIVHYPTHCNEETNYTSYIYIKFLLFLKNITSDIKNKIVNYLVGIIDTIPIKYNLHRKIKLILDHIDDENEYDILYDLLEFDGTQCHSALSASIWCIIRNANTPEKIVGKGIAYGGDCDTIGSLCGQMAGILFGEKSINHKWLGKLENHDKIINLLEKLIF